MNIVEKQYQLYLEKVGLNESQMHPIQRQETKRAFFGAAGQIVFWLRDEANEDEDKAIEELESIKNEVLNFFQKETNATN